MKTGNTYYLQLSRHIFNTEPYKSMSQNAKWLYVVLKELEQRYVASNSKSNRDYFLRSDKDLASDACMSLTTLKRAKSELCRTDLIETWQAHYIIDSKTKKLTEYHTTAYRIKI